MTCSQLSGVRPFQAATVLQQLYDAYLGDAAVQGFIAENNAPALKEIAARFREAVDRGLWAPRRNSTYDELRALAGGLE